MVNMGAIIPCSTNMVRVRHFWELGGEEGAGAFLCYFSFLYFGGDFNKTIIPLAFVRYEMIILS